MLPDILIFKYNMNPTLVLKRKGKKKKKKERIVLQLSKRYLF